MGNNAAAIGGITGGLVGAYFGAPGLGFIVGSLIGGLIDPVEGQKLQGPQIGDSQNQQSLYGTTIPILYGQNRMAGNVIWGMDVEEFAKTESSGGKGGQPKQETETFQYFWSGAIALSQSEIVGIRKIWINDQLYTDLTAPKASAPLNIRVYTGTQTQRPEPFMEARDGVGNVPAYRGLAYVFIERFKLEGSSIPPTFHFEVIAKGSSDINADIVVDVLGETSGSSRVELDPDTGFVWMTKLNQVNVYSCNGGLSLIKTFPHNAARGISWQPSYVLQLFVPVLGTSYSVVPARMWVASYAPDLGTNSFTQGYLTDGSYAENFKIDAPINNSAFCWPGMVLIDKSTITPLQAGLPGTVGGIIASINGICNAQVVFDPSGFVPIKSELFNAFDRPADWTDVPSSNTDLGTIYSISESGVLTKAFQAPPINMDADFYDLTYVVLATVSIGNVSNQPGNSVAYDPIEDRVYALAGTTTPSSGRVFTKYDASLNEIWSVHFPASPITSFAPKRVRYHEGIGDIWLGGDAPSGQNQFWRIDKTDGTVLQTVIVANANITINDFILYPGAPMAVAATIGKTLKVPLVAGAIPTAPTLAEVITDLVERTGTLTAADIDVTGLTAIPVLGYIVGRRQPISDILKPLLETYFVDPVEADGKIKFVLRGTLGSTTIPLDDLSAHSFGGEVPSAVVSQRTQENELPRSMDGRFIDVNNEYKVSVVNTRRLTGESQQILSQSIPIVFDVDVVKQVIDTLLFNTWADREPRDFLISRKYLKLTPTDVITVVDPDLGEVTLRINRVEYHFPQLIKVQAIIEDVTVYSGFTFPGENTDAELPEYPLESNALPVLLDLPPLRSQDDYVGIYVGAYSLNGQFRAAEVSSSNDNLAYTPQVAITTQATVGSSAVALGWTGSFK